MRRMTFALLLLIPAAVAHAQNVETRVQTRVETQVDTTIKSGAAPSGADLSYDEVSFNAVGVAKTEKEAAIEAYYTGLSKILRQLAGAQAETSMGKKFRDDMERDFVVFKRRFFSSDTAHVCRPLDRENKPIAEKDKKTPVVAFQCRADGTIRVLALKDEFQNQMKSTERTLSNSLNFIISFADGKASEDAIYVARKLEEVFAAAGFTVISKSNEAEALGAGKVDYSLSIYSIEYLKPDYSANEQRLTGAVAVQFKLQDLKNGTQGAVLPRTSKLSVSGKESEALKLELRDKLAVAVAQEIGRHTAATVVKDQQSREANEKAKARVESGQKQFVVRIVGISPRDRKQLAEMRTAIKAAVPDALPEINSSESNDTLVTINFATANPKFDPEDVLDKLFDAYKANKSFDAKYKGNNEFSITF